MLLQHVALNLAPKRTQTVKALQELQWLNKNGDVNTSSKAQEYASKNIANLCTGLTLEHDLAILYDFQIAVIQFKDTRNWQSLRAIKFCTKCSVKKLNYPAESANFASLATILGQYQPQAPSLQANYNKDDSQDALDLSLDKAFILSDRLINSLESRILLIGND